jgi:hypothetical protein
MKPISSARWREGHGLPLWRIGIVLPLAFLCALATAAFVFSVGWRLLAVTEVKAEGAIDSKTLFDLVKLAFGVVAGAGALVALVVAYRKQRVDEAGALREATRLHTERFTAAVGQLGDPSPAVRLGGVHALAGLADDAPMRGLRQTCIDVLCAYVRMPYAFVPDDSDPAARQDYLAAREVRHTVLRVISEHLPWPDADEERRRISWQGYRFSFDGAVFDGGAMSFCDFTDTRLSFRGCRFVGGGLDMSGSLFGRDAALSFERAEFEQGTLDLKWAQVGRQASLHISFARVSGGTVDLSSSHVDGDVSIRHTQVDEGVLDLRGIRFGEHGSMSFEDSHFSGFAEVDCTGWRVGPPASDSHQAWISFRSTTGTPPEGLLPPAGAPLPSRVRLPSAWLSQGDAQG